MKREIPFRIFAETFAIWVMPCLLALIAFAMVLVIWVALPLGLLPPSRPEMAQIGGLLYMIYVYETVKGIGEMSPFHRETPQALRAYVLRFLQVLFIVTLLIFVVDLVVVVIFQQRYKDATLSICFVCLLAGCYLFNRVAAHVFAMPPISQKEPDLVRGQDLEDSEEVERKAWHDD